LFLKWIFSDSVVLWITTYLRKIAHFILYAILGGFLEATLLNTNLKKGYLKVIFAAVIGLFYSITDEFHQTFIDGRSGEVADVLLDFCGVLFGISICLVIYKIIKISAKNNKKSKT
jgi:VanZ family protein